ncbi:MAG: hypothetical protein ACM3ZQ_03410 [Bacillota bacterium]
MSRNAVSIHKITKRRQLPFPGEVMVEIGQRVEPSTLVAETRLSPEEPYSLPVMELFGRPPYEIGNHVLKQVGDEVQMGEAIAQGPYDGRIVELRSPGVGRIEQISPLLGTVSIRLAGDPNEPSRKVNVAQELEMLPITISRFLQVKVGDQVKIGQVLAQEPEGGVCYAPIAGEIISIQSGVVEIKRPFKPTLINAYIAGTVTDLLPRFGAEISTEGLELHGLFGLGGEAAGALRVMVSRPDDVLDAADLDETVRGRILVAGSLVTEAAIRRAREMGAVGIVSGGLRNLDLVRLLGKELDLGITGLEKAGITLIAMEGMGRVPLRHDSFELLRAMDGQLCSINGMTQIRAGVIRPELVISEQRTKTDTPSSEQAVQRPQPGCMVRIVREPYFGQVGKIEGIPPQPVTFESGVTTDVYLVRIQGELVPVARANVEVF